MLYDDLVWVSLHDADTAIGCVVDGAGNGSNCNAIALDAPATSVDGADADVEEGMRVNLDYQGGPAGPTTTTVPPATTTVPPTTTLPPTTTVPPTTTTAPIVCTKPAVNHALIVLGGTGVDYASAAGSFGIYSLRGVAIDGSAQFPGFSSSFNSTGVTNYVTGGYSGTLPHANNGWWSGTGFPYDQQEWIDYANDLADAAEANPSAYPNVNVYRLNGGTATITNDGGDYPQAAHQKLHLAVGEGTLRTTQGQNDKTDGAIIAPQATVDVDRRVNHIHGFVVAARFYESFAISGTNINNTGLGINAQIPDAFVDICS